MSEENKFDGNIDELITPEFDTWWEESGQFIRSGGDSYNRSFAYGAFRHLMPEILRLRAHNAPASTGEIKHVPLFGDQGLFNEADPDAVLAVQHNDKISWFSEDDKSSAVLFSAKTSIALRRIIRAPVWTKADQQAGRLPGFLSKIVFTGGDEPEIVEYLGDAGEGIWYFRRKCGSVTFAPVGYFEPIETETERQQREWIKKAKDITPVYDATEFGYLDQLHIVLSSIHDALQSGELKMPGVRK